MTIWWRTVSRCGGAPCGDMVGRRVTISWGRRVTISLGCPVTISGSTRPEVCQAWGAHRCRPAAAFLSQLGHSSPCPRPGNSLSLPPHLDGNLATSLRVTTRSADPPRSGKNARNRDLRLRHWKFKNKYTECGQKCAAERRKAPRRVQKHRSVAQHKTAPVCQIIAPP